VLAITEELVQWQGIERILIQTIPSSPLRWIRHGFDHMFLVRLRLSRHFKHLHLLQKIHAVRLLRRSWTFIPKQSHLTKTERHESVRGLFALHEARWKKIRDPKQVAVIVIDDVLTTGATMEAALGIFHAQNIPAIGLSYCHQPINSHTPHAF
jgi:predicted amidophosphoribosyltransferase